MKKLTYDQLKEIASIVKNPHLFTLMDLYGAVGRIIIRVVSEQMAQDVDGSGTHWIPK